MADSFERQVFDALKTRLETATWQKSVEWEKVKLAVSEFRDDKLPVIQFWFDEEPFTHQKQLLETELRITIEIVMKSTQTDVLEQGDLLDRMRDVREILGADPRLGLNGGHIYHVKMLRAARDFVTQAPFMIGIVQIAVLGKVPWNC